MNTEQLKRAQWSNQLNELRKHAWNNYWHTSKNYKGFEPISEEIFDHIQVVHWILIRHIDCGGND